MIDSDVEINFVRVFETRGEGASSQASYLWAAAVPREEAVTAVEKAVPFGWHAVLAAEQRLADVNLPVFLQKGQMYRIGQKV